jgi:hypothetical protein
LKRRIVIKLVVPNIWQFCVCLQVESIDVKQKKYAGRKYRKVTLNHRIYISILSVPMSTLNVFYFQS